MINKKGVVTTFVILGMVILAIVVMVYTFRSELLNVIMGKELKESMVLPPEAEKVRTFIDGCIKQTLEEAISLMSLQGGYIDLPIGNPPTLIDPFSSNLDIFGDKGSKVPYWFYETSNGIQKNQVPSIKDMEDEINSYINLNLDICINNFQILEQQGYSITNEGVNTETSLTATRAVVDVNFPVHMKLDDFEMSLENFEVSVDSYINELYNMGKKILEYENDKYFLEEKAIDMMVVYDQIPFSGVDFECSPKHWTKTDVYNDLKGIFAANIPLLRIYGTDYDGEGIKSFEINALNKKYRDVTVNFIYLESWPLLMEVIGENGEVLRGKPFTLENDASRFLLPLFCLNDYHFVYNIKFPILITLSKGDSVFQFATQGIIKNNQPRENRLNLGTFEVERPICDYPSKQLTVIAESYRQDGYLEAVLDAKISLRCINQVCEMGRTRSEEGGISLTKAFPSCYNGLLIAEKEGFHRGEEVVSTNQELDKVSVIMEPLKELDVEIVVIDEGSRRSMYPSEQVIFTFENLDNKYVTNLIYPGQNKIKLAAGEYTIISSLIIESDSGFKLKEKEIKTCIDAPKKGFLGVVGLTEKKCMTHKIDSIKINQIPVGGSSDTWFVERDALLSSNKITLYTLRGPTPQTVDEITKVTDLIREKEVQSPELK